MPIRFRCPSCKKLLSISSSKATQVVPCPVCSSSIQVPESDEAPQPSAVAKSAEAPPIPKSPPPLPPVPAATGSPATPIAPPRPAASSPKRTPVPVEASPKIESLASKGSAADGIDDIVFSEAPSSLTRSGRHPDRSMPAPASSSKDKVDAAHRGSRQVEASAPHHRSAPPADDEPVNDDIDDTAEPPIVLRSGVTEMEEMDLTPMVDVVFQLLIFFMVTASFTIQKSIRLPIPDPDSQGAVQATPTQEEMQQSSILVAIDETGQMLVDEEPLGSAEALTEKIRDKMRVERKTDVVITAHSLARHRVVVSAVDAANEAGVQKIRLATRSAPRP